MVRHSSAISSSSSLVKLVLLELVSLDDILVGHFLAGVSVDLQVRPVGRDSRRKPFQLARGAIYADSVQGLPDSRRMNTASSGTPPVE